MPVARVSDTPPTLNVVVAWMSTDPAVVVLIVILHLPVLRVVRQSSRLLPVPPQLLPSSGLAKAALAVLLSNVKTTHVPFGAGAKPVIKSPPCPAVSPSSCCTVAVIVCALFTAFVAVSGLTAILASTYTLLASALLRPPVPVARVSETPPTLNVVVAWMSTDPGVDVLIWTVQLPLVVVHVFTPPTKAAPAVLFSRLSVQVVPFGAGPKPVTASPGAPAVRPSSCWIVQVIVWGSLTAFVSVSGLKSI